MLYAHGSDLCHDLELRHAMANCFEALMGALFLDGGIEVISRFFIVPSLRAFTAFGPLRNLFTGCRQSVRANAFQTRSRFGWDLGELPAAPTPRTRTWNGQAVDSTIYYSSGKVWKKAFEVCRVSYNFIAIYRNWQSLRSILALSSVTYVCWRVHLPTGVLDTRISLCKYK